MIYIYLLYFEIFDINVWKVALYAPLECNILAFINNEYNHPSSLMIQNKYLDFQINVTQIELSCVTKIKQRNGFLLFVPDVLSVQMRLYFYHMITGICYIDWFGGCPH